MRIFGLVVAAACAACAAPGEDGGAARLVSVAVDVPPTVDGDPDDPAWAAARPLEVVARRVVPPLDGSSTEASLRSVHTADHIYVIVRWRDGTRDDVDHKPWTWDGTKGFYVEGPEREDMLSVAFELEGSFDPDMLAGIESAWDVWQWKAVRTNPRGFAMDRTHRYTRAKPEGKAKSHEARSGGIIWIARPEDAGDTVERKQPAPKERQGDRVPQYRPGTPSGSAADVTAKGNWADGWWTVELRRAWDTGQPDDARFERGRTLRFAVATHDRTGDMDKASGVLELVFE